MPDSSVLVVSKIGDHHLSKSMNNQDYYFKSDKLKMVFDGCSAGENSEVGAILFSSLFSEIEKDKMENPELFEENVEQVFKRMLSLTDNIQFIFDKYCFTIVAVFETEEGFIVKYAGDGFIIAKKLQSENEIEYIPLEDGCEDDCPKYYIYNYIPPEFLTGYKDGIKFETRYYSKDEYERIGVATDGLRFVEKLDFTEKNKLREHILNIKPGKIKMLINRNRIHFFDDITICY